MAFGLGLIALNVTLSSLFEACTVAVSVLEVAHATVLVADDSVNSPGGTRSVPYVPTQFRQSLLDDNGQQMALFTFAVYNDRLDVWLAGL